MSTNPEDARSVRYMRLPEVMALTGLSRGVIYKWMREEPPRFPRPVKLGRAVAWKAGELIAWLASRPSADYPRAA